MEQYILKENNRYKIMTPVGFKNFGGIRKLNKPKHYILKLSNGNTVKCSETHPFIFDGNEVLAKNLKVGSRINGDVGKDVLVDYIQLENTDIELYDVVEVDGGNIFNVDGIISHNCNFNSSGDTVIDPELLHFYEETFVKEPLEKSGVDGNLWRWEYPDPHKAYMVIADVSRGDSSDYSACHVIEIGSVTQVAEYKGKMTTTDFGNFLVSLATEYNDALLVIENANIGWAAIQQVINRNYGNLFYMSTDLKYVDTQRQMSNKYRAQEKGLIAGFSTTIRTRPLIISKLDTYFRQKEVIIRSQRTIDELLVFIWNGAKAEAMRGFNDDLVMSLSIGLWVRDTAIRLRQEGIDLTRSSINSISSATQSSGIYNSNTYEENPWIQKINGKDEDLQWLL